MKACKLALQQSASSVTLKPRCCETITGFGLMTRFPVVALLALVFFLPLGGVHPVQAQDAGGGPPESGLVEPENEGRRLGNVPNDQMRQFKMRRDCEMDLPECLPAIRAIIEAEKRERMYLGFGIAGVLLLIFLIALRESEKKKKRVAKEMARHRKLREKVKARWGEQVKDPYKDVDPLGDD